MRNTWYVYTVEHHWAIRKNKILPFTTTRMGPGGTMLRELSQRKMHTVWFH